MPSDFRWHSFLVSAGYLPDTRKIQDSPHFNLILNTKKVAWKVKTMTAFFVAQNEEKENEKYD